MVRRKLKSKKGASVLFALLLFLICSVIGSVVLAAGTAASGRVSGLTESDRRYYAVTSAAELFRDALDGQTLVVTRTQAQNYTVTAVDDIPRPTGGTADGGPAFAFYLGSAEDGTALSSHGLTGESVLTGATLDYVLGVNRTTSSDAAVLTHRPGSGSTWSAALPIEVSADGLETVYVTAKLDGGVLRLRFENAEETPTYRLSLTLTPSWQFARQPQSYTETGALDVTVLRPPETEGGEDGEEPEPLTRYTLHYTEHTDNSVIVSWQASPIEREEAE